MTGPDGRVRATGPALPLLLFLLACADPSSAQPRELSAVDRERPAESFRLPGDLYEISGLAWHPSGVLLAHDDEVGVVFSIDPSDGEVSRRVEFPLAERLGDFEGIAVLEGGRILTTTSTGRIVSVDPETGETEAWDSGVSQACEIEGLAALPGASEVILACKTLYQGSDRDAVVLLRVPASESEATPQVHLVVEGDELRRADVPRPFFPSGVEVVDGGYLVLSARRARVLAVDSAGRILDVARLRGSDHPQAEGITVDPDGNLWIADEGDGGRARLARYPLGWGR